MTDHMASIGTIERIRQLIYTGHHDAALWIALRSADPFSMGLVDSLPIMLKRVSPWHPDHWVSIGRAKAGVLKVPRTPMGMVIGEFTPSFESILPRRLSLIFGFEPDEHRGRHYWDVSAHIVHEGVFCQDAADRHFKELAA